MFPQIAVSLYTCWLLSIFIVNRSHLLWNTLQFDETVIIIIIIINLIIIILLSLKKAGNAKLGES